MLLKGIAIFHIHSVTLQLYWLGEEPVGKTLFLYRSYV